MAGQRLRPLLGLEAPQAEREESFAAWTLFLASVARDRPTVLVVEDAHWADDAMLAFLDHLVGQELEVPLLLLVTTRPELLRRRPAILEGADDAAASRLILQPLSGEDGGTLLTSLLDARLAPGVAERMVDLAGGNPLFVEQYVRLLLERGLLVLGPDGLRVESSADLPLPETVQAVLAARLDSLPAGQKAVLCDASVIGESFWRGCVAVLSGRSLAEVDEALAGLTARGLTASDRTQFDGRGGRGPLLARRGARTSRTRRYLAACGSRSTGPPPAGWRAPLVTMPTSSPRSRAPLRDGARSGEGVHLAHEVDDLAFLAGRQLFRAGERNRVLDAAASERQLEQALELLPAEASERSRLLLLHAEALSWQRPDEAVAAFNEALDAMRAGNDPNEVASCLVQLAECMFASGTGDWRGPVDEAIAFLDESRPTIELAVALQELACVSLLGNGDAVAAVDYADRSLAAAERLGGPLPVGALGGAEPPGAGSATTEGSTTTRRPSPSGPPKATACNW